VSRPDRATESLVRTRAKGVCEFCHFPEHLADTPFQIDHVIAEKHGGQTDPSNLAYACFYCNSYKGPNVAGVDPETSEVLRLFNPRVDDWRYHFKWDGPKLVGLTPLARATIQTLRINQPDAISARTALIVEGVFDFIMSIS
jgi:hypothetical protein